jgi:hypothetical protein
MLQTEEAFIAPGRYRTANVDGFKIFYRTGWISAVANDSKQEPIKVRGSDSFMFASRCRTGR